ncbi:hypothetical protein GGX14DRAFT_109669 [Mycena pura]|uniref:Uncharacterized protein n=1 Tax=Mycena pura TaxID=153505 RepID=A0AAD6VES7_9AGAR|nr:hypothetical protein GGX14DRAFT_109669 [Mycena pura]
MAPSAFGSWFRLPRDQPSEFEETADGPLQAAIMAFNILSATGFILLLVIFFTAWLSSNVKRVSTWYMYILAWTVFCITPFPVIGHQTHSNPPSFATCVVDSALMYASRPLVAFGTLSLILHLYFNVSTRLRRDQVRPHIVLCLLVLPPILYLVIFLWTLILGFRNPSEVEVEPGGFYCHIANPLPATIDAVLVGSAACAVLLTQALTVILLCRNWRAFRALQRREEYSISLSIIIRVSVFAILPTVGLAMSFTTYVPKLVGKYFTAYNIILATSSFYPFVMI